MSNPLTKSERRSLKDWANLQYGISRRYKDIDLGRSEFYHGRSVAAGKIASTYNPDKIESIKRGMKVYCSICGKVILTRYYLYEKGEFYHLYCYRRKFPGGINPTLVMPIKSKKQLGHLFKAQSQLSKAGVTFDSGTSIQNRKPTKRHWELDWSLKGAKIRNPTQRCWKCEELFNYRFADTEKLRKRGFQIKCPTCGSINEAGAGLTELELERAKVRKERIHLVKHLENPIRHTKQGWFWGSVGPQSTKKALLAQIRAIYAGGFKGRNPSPQRPRKRMVDGRLKLNQGDRVKIVKRAREGIFRNTGIEVKPRDLWTVTKIQYDISGGKFGVVIESGGAKLYMRTSDLIYYDSPKSQNPTGLYQAFHGNPPKGTRKVFYEPPKGELIKIGRLANIEYIPEPPSKYVGTRFTHEAGDLGHKIIKSNAILATNKEGTQLYIVKEKNTKYPRFSGRGILG